MQEADIVLLLARLMATVGRILLLARRGRNAEALWLVQSLLVPMCHGMEAIEQALQEKPYR